MAAQESSRFVRQAARMVSTEVLEQLDAYVAWLATEYLRRPPYALFRRLASSRADVFALIDARPNPAHLTDLYRLAGRLSALLAHASSDLGQAHAAESHARSALLCADYAGDPGLSAYVRWVQSNIAYWQGDHPRAVDLARAGRAHATCGHDTLRLVSQQARALAAAGRTRDCETALGEAVQIRDNLGDEPRPAGVFAFPAGKAAYYASEISLSLAGASNARRAVAEAAEALVLLDSDPQTHQSAELQAAANLDLAAAHLELGDLDAAAAHTRQVLTLPAESRTVPILARIKSTSLNLSAPAFVTTPTAVDLREQIEVFTAYPATRDLPQ